MEERSLSRADFDRIAAWMNLGIPLCRNYREAHTWGAAKEKKYDDFPTL